MEWLALLVDPDFSGWLPFAQLRLRKPYADLTVCRLDSIRPTIGPRRYETGTGCELVNGLDNVGGKIGNHEELRNENGRTYWMTLSTAKSEAEVDAGRAQTVSNARVQERMRWSAM